MKKIILLGDSITAGYEEGVTDFRLNEQIEVEFKELEVINAGIPGDTTRGALQRLEAHVLRYQPDVVTVFFGANDVSTIMGISIEEYIANLILIVKQIGEERVILLGVPYCNQNLYQEERGMERLELYNRAAKEIAANYQLPFIELLYIMQEKSNLYLQKDGLHFSRAGYELLGQLINQELKKRKGVENG
ncbi:SGNH/GDSL hydrolase family protein [Vagococcus hydrophili]|uniref:Lipase n=1 Tax=Vagococcus hydrophili TaxID=2714947 RepID=A0A6G8ATG4_9ENTE|nr:GDSL-type esterase/lipase family protein [Vagococcus hydrophili]QIL48368.1 lipase [Vagococcus hydrophili]